MMTSLQATAVPLSHVPSSTENYCHWANCESALQKPSTDRKRASLTKGSNNEGYD